MLESRAQLNQSGAGWGGAWRGHSGKNNIATLPGAYKLQAPDNGAPGVGTRKPLHHVRSLSQCIQDPHVQWRSSQGLHLLRRYSQDPHLQVQEVSSATSSCISSGTPSAPLTSPLPEHVEIPPVSDAAWLPTKLLKTIPPQDQKWISAALWKNQHLRTDLQLWYDPPEPSLIYHQVPTPERFFNHRLLLWMPYHLWKVRLSCPACGTQLTSYGVHKRARHILDVDRYYLMITETLWCSSAGCKTTYLSSSKTILDQLGLAHRLEFRLILTRKFACDMRVIRFLRERALGNSPTRLVRQLRENHSEECLKRLCRYFGACSDFAARSSLFPVRFQVPPEPVDVPSHRWMLAVYGRDILSRLDHIKASITSTFGSILKIDSTKKITKKLSGIANGTALWLTYVSNERGQILISVLSAQEGAALDRMATGLICRYSNAGVAPPQLLYVDCDCCREGRGQTKLKERFGGWPDLIVKLDIYHFMRRLASGCTKDAHPLYPVFMSKLASCIFEWDRGDVALLRQAKREQLRQEGVPGITDTLVDQHITKDELALHCRRQTRGERQTVVMIEQLLKELMGAKGRDFLGVPLLDQERTQHIWQVQQRHVKCIQDEPGVLLYTQTGTTTKAGIVLPNYRCARGSTSLESFHRHVNRFIPGTNANSLNFQLYLLEGLNRWNQYREAASQAVKPASLLSYSGDLVNHVNTLSLKVFGRHLVPPFQPPAVYTGELLGIDYLYSQTGQALQDVHPDSEETEALLEDVGTEEELEDEGFEESWLDPTVELLILSDPAPFTTSSARTPTPTSLQPSPSPAVSTLTAPEQQLPVDERGIPGMDRVDSLAEYLVGLRKETGQMMSNQQASTIIALWQNLLPYDQQRVAYAAHHQVGLTTGRFRCSKKRPEFTPGVESTTHCVLASSGSPAQWPDCSRLVESICVKLCNIHKSPKKQGIRSGSWSRGMPPCFDINQTTLTQWHHKRLKRQDSRILLQGVNLPDSVPVAARPLPPVQARPPAVPPRPGPHHQYHLPRSTVGQAVDKRKSAAQRQLFSQPPPPAPVLSNPSPFIVPVVFVTPTGNKRIVPSGPLPSPPPTRRAYTRTVEKNKCRQCHLPRIKDNGHGQYYGNIYCPKNNRMPLEEWMEEMRRKREGNKNGVTFFVNMYII
ncbi:hypothetical protein N1851_000589 [Merluccius polli]|uniref:DUF6729 domain-containing protein n=1 Tax=Merluccius polli TaxID=89951 RepID=A0AA47NCZ1_MERPO|nr:hypothetical protein N1851_000589 [Merluccius polli]